MNPKIRQIMTELRRRLSLLYGERLVRVILFGSRARSDARPDSDIDIMVVLQGDVDHEIERRRVIPITADLSLENNVVILSIYMSEKRYAEEQSPLLRNVRAERIAA